MCCRHVKIFQERAIFLLVPAKRHKAANDIVKTVASEVIELYTKASIPTIAFDSIV